MMTAGIFALPVAAQADDFGSRFSGDTPSALNDTPQTFGSEEFDPSSIEPAAGNPSGDAFTEDSIGSAPSQKTPEELISEIEKLISDIEGNVEEQNTTQDVP